MTEASQAPSATPDYARIKRINKIGKLGEKRFSSLATEADLIVNRSEEDEAGWDFFVEPTPESASPSLPPAPVHSEFFSFQAKVQVKSTDGTEGHVDVKLSNWLRMVESPLPAFFTILEFDGKNAPQRGFVVHVGGALIRKVLERAHRNAIEDQSPLNRIKLRLSYSSEHQLDKLEGPALLSHLHKGMAEGGTTWSGYSEWKRSLVNSAGFEGGNIQIKIQVPRQPDLPGDIEEILSDFETGLLPALPVERLEVYRTRFGMVDSDPYLSRIKGVLEITGRPSHPVSVEVRAVGTTTRCRFAAELYAPSKLPTVMLKGGDLSPHKMRILAPHVEIVAELGNRKGILRSTPPEAGEEVGGQTIKLHAELHKVVATAVARSTIIDVKVSRGADPLLQYQLGGGRSSGARRRRRSG